MNEPTPAASTGAPLKTIDEMNLLELKAYAKAKGYQVPTIGAKTEVVRDAIKAIEQPSTPTPEVTTVTDEKPVPLAISLDDFAEQMTQPDAKFPLALTEEQRVWLHGMDANLDAFTKDPDGIWRREPTEDDKEAKAEDAPAPDPAPASTPDPAPAPEPSAPAPPLEVKLPEKAIAQPMDVSIEEFARLMGESGLPYALTDEQHSWLQANTVFQIELWNLDPDGIWRRAMFEEEPRQIFDEGELDFDVTENEVKEAVQGWLFTDVVDRAVVAHSSDGWREAIVREDGSVSITFHANIPRHDRVQNYRDSQDVTISAGSLDDLIVTLIGLRMGAVKAFGQEEDDEG